MSNERIGSLRPDLTPKNLVRAGLALTLGGAALAGARILEERNSAHAVLNSNPEPAEVFDASSRPDLLPQLDGHNASPERREILQPLSTEIAGEIRNAGGTLRGYFVEVNNPNDSATDWWVQSTEYDNQGNIVATHNFGPCRPPVGNSVIDPDSYEDLWSYWGGPVMVSAGSSVLLEVPLVNGSRSDVRAFTGTNCNREFWGFEPTDDLVLGEIKEENNLLRVRVQAKNSLETRGVAQVQLVLLNKEGRVVDLEYSNTNEYDLMRPGNEVLVSFDLSRTAPHEDYRIVFLPLQKTSE